MCSRQYVDGELEHVDIGHRDVEGGLHLTEERDELPQFDESVGSQEHDVVPHFIGREPHQREYLYGEYG